MKLTITVKQLWNPPCIELFYEHLCLLYLYFQDITFCIRAAVKKRKSALSWISIVHYIIHLFPPLSRQRWRYTLCKRAPVVSMVHFFSALSKSSLGTREPVGFSLRCKKTIIKQGKAKPNCNLFNCRGSLKRSSAAGICYMPHLLITTAKKHTKII